MLLHAPHGSGLRPLARAPRKELVLDPRFARLAVEDDRRRGCFLADAGCACAPTAANDDADGVTGAHVWCPVIAAARSSASSSLNASGQPPASHTPSLAS